MVFISFDLLMSYWQLAVHEDNIHFLAYLLPSGKWAICHGPIGYLGSGDELSISSRCERCKENYGQHTVACQHLERSLLVGEQALDELHCEGLGVLQEEGTGLKQHHLLWIGTESR